MRFLEMPDAAPQAFGGLTYAIKGHRAHIRRLLVDLQRGYCAYSERWLDEPLDSEEIEHFTNDIKGSEHDGFFNWYVVLRKANQLKMGKHWSEYQPLPEPYTVEVQQRLDYKEGVFCPKNQGDQPISNLIEFTGAQDYPVVAERRNHISRIRWYRTQLTAEQFEQMFREDPRQLSFPTAIEAELGIPAFQLIEKLKAPAAQTDE